MSQALSVDSDLSLVGSGDLNKNGQIDSGDTVKFKFKISNPTAQSYQSLQLKTNIDTKKINGLNQVTGTMNIDQTGDTIVIPNISLNPNQVRNFSFETQINFNKDTDQQIATEAELVSGAGSIAKSGKKEVSAKKMEQELFDKFVHNSKE